jgi:two-component system sensor histidine kinase FlrB
MDLAAACLEPPENHLTDAFAAFIAAANRLEHSHWQLHDEVNRLRSQLEERNRELACSLAENEGIRIMLRGILDALPCGVIVLDAESREVALLNPEARKLLDIPADQPPCLSEIPACVRNTADCLSPQAPSHEHEREVCIEGPSGKRWLAIRSSAMESMPSATETTPAPPKVILTAVDATAHKLAEQERETSRRMMALAEMSAVLAHEIRNPLGSLELLTGLLAADAGLSGDSRQWVQHLQAGVRTLSATVNNVLHYHSPGSSQLVRLRFAEILKSSVDFIRPLAQQNGIAVALEESLGATEILGDRGGIQQVILNLACNSLRHTPPGGRITVCGKLELRAPKNVVLVEFFDTGSGIAPENLAHVFDPGFSSKGQSPGLGLTISERIMKQHHGTITVQSEVGKGTTFHMEFPAL